MVRNTLCKIWLLVMIALMVGAVTLSGMVETTQAQDSDYEIVYVCDSASSLIPVAPGVFESPNGLLINTVPSAAVVGPVLGIYEPGMTWINFPNLTDIVNVWARNMGGDDVWLEYWEPGGFIRDEPIVADGIFYQFNNVGAPHSHLVLKHFASELEIRVICYDKKMWP